MQDVSTETAAPAAPETLTVYTTDWCPFCLKLKADLRSDGIEFVEIDIEQQPAAAEFVASVNGGDHVVPTVHFPNGEVVTNPPFKGVRRRLGLARD
ncbi:glutaredoxin domain-containing protein [Tomitella cavernea]|uniref:Mycoredoxin Mrx1 n=1 Tax=Tomitella cavernea TaxID=1387982 RepID=A0ABP9CUB1_9ACTN|nr:glutaredoxin domain-containing protein [Tomitella cavernea]